MSATGIQTTRGKGLGGRGGLWGKAVLTAEPVIRYQLYRDLRAQYDKRGKDAKVVAGTISASLEKRAKEVRGRAGDKQTHLVKEDSTVENDYRKKELDWICYFQMSVLAELSQQISKIETQN